MDSAGFSQIYYGILPAFPPEKFPLYSSLEDQYMVAAPVLNLSYSQYILAALSSQFVLTLHDKLIAITGMIGSHYEKVDGVSAFLFESKKLTRQIGYFYRNIEELMGDYQELLSPGHPDLFSATPVKALGLIIDSSSRIRFSGTVPLTGKRFFIPLPAREIMSIALGALQRVSSATPKV